MLRRDTWPARAGRWSAGEVKSHENGLCSRSWRVLLIRVLLNFHAFATGWPLSPRQREFTPNPPFIGLQLPSSEVQRTACFPSLLHVYPVPVVLAVMVGILEKALFHSERATVLRMQ